MPEFAESGCRVLKSLRVAAAVGSAGLLSASVFLLPARGADRAQNSSIPPLMLPYTSGWAGGFTGPLPPVQTYLPTDYLNNPANIQGAIARGAPRDKSHRLSAGANAE